MSKHGLGTAACSNPHWYERILPFREFSSFSYTDNYSPLPQDWWVVVADIRGSTRAIENGRYRDVNSVSAACIVAMINAVAPLQVPFVFGGDGATLCIPPDCRDAVARAMVASQQLASREFDLQLRIGMVTSLALIEAGAPVQVARYQPHRYFQQAMFTGGGLGLAEQWIKQEDSPWLLDSQTIPAAANFGGFECRWQEVPSPAEETVAIMVEASASDTEGCAEALAQAARCIFSIYGNDSLHHPLRSDSLRLLTSPASLMTETRIRCHEDGFWKRLCYVVRTFGRVCAGRYLMRLSGSSHWAGYRKRLLANTDYRKCDDGLRLVLAGTTDQRVQLEQQLEALEQQRLLVFGIHASRAALLTCLVFDYSQHHVHFLDAADGGYAMASKDLKRRRKKQ